MIIDGKKLAEEIKEELKKEVAELGKRIKLAVIYIGENSASDSFIKRKKAFGKEIGAEVEIKKPSEEIRKSRTKLRAYISDIVHDKKNTGVIVQLPLPEEIKQKTEYFLDAIPANKDADVLSSESLGKFASGRFAIMPPVVGAIKYILEKNSAELRGKNIAVVGAGGKLVGKPVVLWLSSLNLPFRAITENSSEDEMKRAVAEADILISGVGKAGLIGADMVKDGVVALDAGVSSDAGTIRGDFEPAVAKKASLFTPVPGGVGPLTVAMLFKNLITLAKK
ncbi:MAG: bifunctional 5,10-methylenetetrahydrofolate dehydrogenase/5,10-methenyltetrahydrofolate cyclohydrolase [Patescibacteria group bacterium]